MNQEIETGGEDVQDHIELNYKHKVKVEVLTIVGMANNGAFINQISREVGLSKPTVKKILRAYGLL